MTNLENLRARAAQFQAEERAALDNVAERRATLDAEHQDRSPAEFHPDSPELLIRPPQRLRVANAEAALDVAERDLERVRDEIARHKKTIGAVEEAALQVAAFERALAPALEADAELTNVAVTALREMTERMSRLRGLYASAMAVWLRIPVAARTGVPPPTLTWLSRPEATAVDVLPWVLRAAAS